MACLLQQEPPFHGIIHQRLISSLFLFLDGEHRILSDLELGVPRSIGLLQTHEAFLARALLQLLVLRTLDQGIDPSLAQQITLHFLRGARLPRRRTRVHPVDLDLLPGPPSGLLHLLQFLDLPLLLPLLHHLLDAFALVERGFLGFPYFFLVAHEHGVP